MRKITTRAVLALAVVGAAGWDSCGQPLTKDPGFDLWCGKELCAWQVLEGAIRRVPTWHRSDFGVELLGDSVVLAQTSRSSGAKCFNVELQAERAAGVELSFELDFLADGKSEHALPVTSVRWEPAIFKLAAPRWYQDVRFVIRKRGAGRAILAHVGITVADDCKTPPILFLDRPDGSGCEQASECRSRRCVETLPAFGSSEPTQKRACGGCATDADCASGELCGAEHSLGLWRHRACMARGSALMGEACLADAACKSGVCCDGLCAECCPDRAACAGGESCKPGAVPSGDLYSLSLRAPQCGPGQPTRAAGAECLRDDDCASRSCLGASTIGYCATLFFWSGGRCSSDKDCSSESKCLPFALVGGVCR
jgi:hypothetical protein